MVNDDMKLPEGKTCGDCAHYSKCEWLIRCKSNNTECDWAPSRFFEKKGADAK